MLHNRTHYFSCYPPVVLSSWPWLEYGIMYVVRNLSSLCEIMSYYYMIPYVDDDYDTCLSSL